MASSKVAEMVDPTEQRQYPIELSPALRGLASKEVFTGVRYNHRPSLSSDTAPSSAKIKPSSSNGAYDLSFTDAGDRYAYTGTRTTKDGNYVLVFDAAREVFVLHRVDSMFHMNLTKTPSDSSAASLREKHPHLDPPAVVTEPRPTKAKAAPKKAAAGSKSATAAAGKKKADVPAPLSLPPPPVAEPPPGKKKRRPADEEEDDDSDSGDGGLLVVEYPGGKAPGATAAVRTSRPNDFSPAFPTPAMPLRRFSQFALGDGDDEEEDDEADADADNEFEAILEEEEEEEEEDDGEEDVQMGDFRLGSPLNGPGVGAGQAMEGGVEEDDDDIDLEAELEAEMEKELAESSVSEED